MVAEHQRTRSTWTGAGTPQVLQANYQTEVNDLGSRGVAGQSRMPFRVVRFVIAASLRSAEPFCLDGCDVR